MDKLVQFLECLFEHHKAMRRIMVIWAICLITWVVTRTFADISVINGAAATALATVTALLTAVLSFYQWSRQHEDKDDH